MAPTPTVEAKPGLGQETSGPDGGDQTGHSLPMDESMENADWDYAQEELMAKTGIDLKVNKAGFFWGTFFRIHGIELGVGEALSFCKDSLGYFFRNSLKIP